LTLYIDPKKDCLFIEASAAGYQPEPHMWGMAIRKRLVPHGGLTWGSDFVLDVYKDPVARLDLVIPNGYRGVVLIRFAPVDSPPAQTGQRNFTYDVGLDGKVAIRESGLFERVSAYENIYSHFRDGTEISTVTVKDRHGTSIPASSVALRFVTVVWENHTWVYVLGTKADADSVHKALWGDGDHFDESAFKRLSGSP
jgi:hypothetical protein